MNKLLFLILYSLVYVSHALPARMHTHAVNLTPEEGGAQLEVLLQLMQSNVCKNDSLALAYYHQLTHSPFFADSKLVKFKTFQSYGDLKYCAGDLDSSIFYYREAATIGLKNNLYNEVGQVLSKLGNFFQSAGNFDSSSFYFNKGLSVAIDAKDSLSMGSIYVGLGTLQQHAGQIDSALAIYFKALDIAERIDDKPLMITAQLNISTIYYDHQPQNLKISDFEAMLEVARSIGDQKREISILEWLGYLKADSGQYDAGLMNFEEGIAVNRLIKDRNREILLMQGISYLYNQAGDYSKSVDTNNDIIDLARQSGYELYLPSLYTRNVSGYLKLKDYEKVVSYAELAIEAGKKSGQVELYYSVYKDLAMAYAKLGNHAQAYEARLEFTRLKDQIYDVQKSRQLAEIQTKYETAKKEAEISALSQRATIQSLEIKQKNIAIVVGVVLIILVALGIYLTLRQRALRVSQMQMELEQRFLRSQLNPHFISNALLAVQNFMLKNQPEIAASYLSKFAKLMRETLENSRKEFILLEDELKMLTNYMDIHKMRMSDRFDYHISVADEIDTESDSIPPMFVQPFVENAIEHGIVNADGKGQIDLTFEKEGEYISIVIQDNGGGLASTDSQSENHTSLSSAIIQERMAIFNKTLKRKIQLVMKEIIDENEEIRGTKVELKVPFR
ncbi:MAG: histidine kinase [Reichenbachiella sp.]|uniref:tetratricopeptide repeat-containing sensor histidine kinase n=1 Tax=Reichenbachiella sp. TaxID=2184521 RepID=UPI003264E9C7